MAFEDGKVASEHIYWDQASLLAQIGLIDSADLPITGAIQAQSLVDTKIALNELITATA
jgi:carboxymethylenebutenolidase